MRSSCRLLVIFVLWGFVFISFALHIYVYGGERRRANFLEFICHTKLDFGPQVYFGRNAEAFLISDFGF